MKIIVKVGEQNFEVEIEDLNARPIVAVVDGERFEVTPEDGVRPEGREEAGAPIEKKIPVVGMSAPSVGDARLLVAPLPGTVVEVFVKQGDQIETGQVVLVIEAMKMKNSIRSMRAGTVGEVLVSAGQTVAHKQALIRFADAGEASWI
ncbi:MAG: biotin/lipoyl-containing protein [Chloroflexota bacterium]